MIFTTSDIFNILIIGILCLFALFLLTAKTENRLSNILLACFLILESLDAGAGFITNLILPMRPGLAMMISASYFLKIPVLLLYVLSVIYSDFNLRYVHLFHILPFIATLLIFYPNFYAVDYDSKMKFLDEASFTKKIEIQSTYLLIHFQLVTYIAIIFAYINRYKKQLLQHYSNASMFNYKWLFQFVALLSLGSLVATFKNLMMFLEYQYAFSILTFITTSLLFVFVCWIVLRALQSPELFKGIESSLQLLKKNTGGLNINSKRSTEEPRKSKQIAQLKAYMKAHQPYLNPSLTIFSLASQVDMPTRELSVLINQQLGLHFFDFINSYRIEDAKLLLSKTERKELTVLEILYQVGFNSKSSFNTAFKKHTQQTPTQYRKAHYSN